MRSLDPGYAIERAPVLSAHAGPARRRLSLVQGEPETSYWVLKLTVREPGITTVWREKIPVSTSRKTAEGRARLEVARRRDRMMLLALSTPQAPLPRPPRKGRIEEGLHTLIEADALRLVRWQRRYVCERFG